MTFAALIAFLESPFGAALTAEIPTLFNDLVAIFAKKGNPSSQEIADYIASGKDFNALCPKRAVVVPLAAVPAVK
jgi:hypothetical protein